MQEIENTDQTENSATKHRERINARRRARYHTDKEYREKNLSRFKERYRNDAEFRERQRAYLKEYHKRYDKENTNLRVVYNATYYEKHREELLAKKRAKYWAKKARMAAAKREEAKSVNTPAAQ